MLFSSNDMHCPSPNSVTEWCVWKQLMNTLLYCQHRMKEEIDNHDSLSLLAHTRCIPLTLPHTQTYTQLLALV